MSLNDWLKNGWLIKHPPRVRGELDDLLAVADRDLHDCKTRGLSDDWRFGIAYNAALQLRGESSAQEPLREINHNVPCIAADSLLDFAPLYLEDSVANVGDDFDNSSAGPGCGADCAGGDFGAVRGRGDRDDHAPALAP